MGVEVSGVGNLVGEDLLLLLEDDDEHESFAFIAAVELYIEDSENLSWDCCGSLKAPLSPLSSFLSFSGLATWVSRLVVSVVRGRLTFCPSSSRCFKIPFTCLPSPFVSLSCL